MSKQYGSSTTATGGIAPVQKLTPTNYNAPTQWSDIGIIKTSDESDDTFYPVYERRLVPYLDLFQYVFLATDRNNIYMPLGTRTYIVDGEDIGVIRGMESKGTWVLDRYKDINWAYTMY
jgi:hypothetical protein